MGKEPSPLEALQAAISMAAERIEAEYVRSKNDWLSCFGSSLFVVETYLDMRSVKAELTDEVVTQAQNKLEAVKLDMRAMRARYGSDKSTAIPDAVKSRLVQSLDVLRK